MSSLTLRIFFTITLFFLYFIFGCLPLVMKLRAASGRDARLPCGKSDPLKDGNTHVAWYKNESEVYRFPPKYLEIRYGTRDQILPTSCNTEFCPNDSGLPIKNVKDQDGGIYICRLHYNNLLTGEITINLTIVEPTEAPRIYNELGRRILLGLVGPYRVGSNVTLTCQVRTGNTHTDLYWLRNGTLIKNAPAPQSGIMQVVIHLYSLHRGNDHDHYECVTQNTDVSQPLVTSALIEIFAPPMSMEIRAGPSTADSTVYMELNKPLTLDCVVIGCVPHPLVSWYTGDRKLHHTLHKETSDGNFTVSTLTLTPNMQHDGKELICRAQNIHIRKDFEVHTTLKVGYPPVSNSTPIEIGAVVKEIESATCIVDAQPPPKEFIWTFADNLTMKSSFSKVIGFENRYIANLTWLSRADDLGLLFCRASNIFGNQTVPCLFNISVGGVPEVPHCDLRRPFPDTLRVRCIKGWDGGRPQTIHLEIFAEDGSRVQNLSDVNGNFFLSELRSETNLSAVIYSSNVRGKSQNLTTYLEIPHGKTTEVKSSSVPSVWVPYVEACVVITAVILFSIFITIIIIKIMKSSRVKNTSPTPDGIFRREPDFFREERLLSLPLNSLDRQRLQTIEYIVPSPPPPPACPVLFDDNPRSSPDTTLQTYYV